MPSPTSLVQNHTSMLMPCSFHYSPFVTSTNGEEEHSTQGSCAKSAASKSVRRNRQTRRLIPESGYPRNLPIRTQCRSVRVRIFRYAAASAAVSHSIATQFGSGDCFVSTCFPFAHVRCVAISCTNAPLTCALLQLLR